MDKYADYIKGISWREAKDLIWSKKVKNPHNWKANNFSWKHWYPSIFVNLMWPNINAHAFRSKRTRTTSLKQNPKVSKKISKKCNLGSHDPASLSLSQALHHHPEIHRSPHLSLLSPVASQITISKQSRSSKVW